MQCLCSAGTTNKAAAPLAPLPRRRWGLGVLTYVLLTGRQPFSSPKTDDPMAIACCPCLHMHHCTICAATMLARAAAPNCGTLAPSTPTLPATPTTHKNHPDAGGDAAHRGRQLLHQVPALPVPCRQGPGAAPAGAQAHQAAGHAAGARGGGGCGGVSVAGLGEGVAAGQGGALGGCRAGPPGQRQQARSLRCAARPCHAAGLLASSDCS